MEFLEGSSFEDRLEEAQRSKGYLAKGVFAKKWDLLGILGVRVGRDDTREQAFEDRLEEAQRSKDYLAKGVFAKKWDPLGILDVQVGRDDTREQAAPAYESAVEEMRKEKKAVSGCAFLGKNEGYISHCYDFPASENLDGNVPCYRNVPRYVPCYEIWEASAETIENLDGNVPWYVSCYDIWEALPETIEQMDASMQPNIQIQPNIRMISEFHEYVDVGRNKRKSGNLLMESGGFVGGNRIQNPTDEAETIWEDSVRWTLRDLEVQPLQVAKTYAILFRNLLNANLPICMRRKDVLSATFRTLRNALKNVWSMQSRGPNIVSNGLSLFTSASKLAVGMVLIGNTPAVGAAQAMAPAAVEPGSLQAQDFEKSSNFWFGVVACIGVLATIITLLKSFNWRRRHSIAGTSAASAPAGSILNRAVNMAQTHTVLRSWRETEFREVVVALREEGAYAS